MRRAVFAIVALRNLSGAIYSRARAADCPDQTMYALNIPATALRCDVIRNSAKGCVARVP